MSTRNELLKLLADGGFHSGTDMGERLGVSRAAVCKAIQALADAGVGIHRVTGRGYRLEAPFRPLDRGRILRAAAKLGLKWKGGLEGLEQTDSTNLELLRQSQSATVHERVCAAEAQTDGRGRRGRGWVATPYRNILFSIAWRFESGSALVGGLSLAAGVAVLRALRAYGIDGAALKWPNDVIWKGRKLAGLLIDVRGEAAGPLLAIVGLGLNVRIEARDAARIDQPWVDLSEIAGQQIDRDRLIALLIREFVQALRQFERAGFAAFKDEWQRHHHYSNKRVGLTRAEVPTLYGTVAGVDDRGALLLRDPRGRVQAFHSGEISMRLAV
ncbi:MAG: biotin--[acetyl-CoA-carboxylase] ligase [Candidatus Muproteobacteria bacterium RBG_16_64_11]|uniref:Bifunctional ligase/repressor BirA n=1 Tax=Candidatus Muproteobacteria bacterium RBG_16_64_11 TaxID=1817758 RepID=A0A1F6T995_9PROT|nr:MAG: biotin--[acetyl-CoA-carboxylase] ligase [Candidatus Muproteobacteria bacterium RBG_16_64_11]